MNSKQALKLRKFFEKKLENVNITSTTLTEMKENDVFFRGFASWKWVTKFSMNHGIFFSDHKSTKTDIVHLARSGDNIIKEPHMRLVRELTTGEDADYIFPEVSGDIYDVITEKDNLLLYGPTGSGKSTIFKIFSKIYGWSFYRINCSNETAGTQLVGERVVEIDEETAQSITTFQHGMLPQAMKEAIKNPERIVLFLIDEIDAAQPENLFTIQRLLEDKTLVIAENFGETIVTPENFIIVATANTNGEGDESGLYTGTNTLNTAFIDRFVRFNFDYTDKESDIIQKKFGIKKDDADKMVEIARGVRQEIDNGTMLTTFSTRKLLRWAKYVCKWKDVKRAYKKMIISGLNTDESQKINEISQRVYGWCI